MSGELYLSPTKICFCESACTQEEVNRCVDSAKVAQKVWARTPLWKRAETLHRAAAILKEQKAPIADCLVKEVAKALKDAVVEVLSQSYWLPFVFNRSRSIS